MWSFSVGVAGIATPEGIAVGSTRAEVLGKYPNAQPVPNEYLEWPDLSIDVEGDDGTDLALRFVFDEADNVDLIMGGRYDEVSLPEGCA